MTILFILLGIVLVVTAIDFHLMVKKNVIFNNMDLIYVSLENYIIKNDINIDEYMEKYLYSMKKLKNNKEFTDIQVMILILKSLSPESIESMRQGIQRIDNQIPMDIREFGNKFYKEATRATNLSKYKPRFVLFLVIKTITIILNNSFKRSCKSIGNHFKVVQKAFNYTFDLERLIISK